MVLHLKPQPCIQAPGVAQRPGVPSLCGLAWAAGMPLTLLTALLRMQKE